jgi:hypothetical protein
LRIFQLSDTLLSWKHHNHPRVRIGHDKLESEMDRRIFMLMRPRCLSLESWRRSGQSMISRRACRPGDFDNPGDWSAGNLSEWNIGRAISLEHRIP